MAIVLLEVLDGPAVGELAQTVKAFRRANPDVFKTTLRTDRSAEDRAVAATFGIRRMPAFVFTDDEGNTLARVRGTSSRALEAALASARANRAPNPGRGAGSHSRFVAVNVGSVIQERRNVFIEGLDPSFAPPAKGLRALACISWIRDEAGRVTAAFPTIRAAEKAFSRLLHDDLLRMERALPDEVAWMNERMNRRASGTP